MDINEFLKEIDTIGGSRNKNAEFIKEKLKQAKNFAQAQNFDASNAISRLTSAYCLFLIEEKLEAIAKIMLFDLENK